MNDLFQYEYPCDQLGNIQDGPPEKVPYAPISEEQAREMCEIMYPRSWIKRVVYGISSDD